MNYKTKELINDAIIYAYPWVYKQLEKEIDMAVENRLQSTVVHNPKTGKSENVVFKDETPGLENFYLENGLPIIKFTNKALAKSIKFTDGFQYFIKFGTDGMYDPLGMYSAGSQGIETQRFGKPVWEYRKVKDIVFSLYIKYLQTQNKSYYLQAVRESKNN